MTVSHCSQMDDVCHSAVVDPPLISVSRMMFLFFFSKSCISQSKPLPFYFYFFTMRSSAKTSILTPRSVKEVNNVLNGDAFSALHGAVVGLDYHLQNATLLTAPDATYFEKSWGVTVADDDSTPTSMKTTMMSACLCVPAIRDIATAHRDERFFQRFFINRMCVDDAARQERLLSQAQHGWHTDGNQERRRSRSALQGPDFGGWMRMKRIQKKQWYCVLHFDSRKVAMLTARLLSKYQNRKFNR
jgi:hypothetical protein